jgi:competence protein ComEC
VWLYVATTAALVAQLAVEQGADVAAAALLASCALTAGSLFLSLPMRPASVAACALVAGVGFGAIAAALHAPEDPRHVLALLAGASRSATAVEIVADVLEPPRQRSYGASAVVEARALRLPDGSSRPVWGRVNLAVRASSGRLRFGERIVFRARLARIANFGNPGEFDYARWSARRALWVSAFVWDDREIATLGASPDAGIVTRLRVAIARAALGERGAAGALTAALVVGDASALPESVMESIRVSGLTHLLAISGMNVGLVALVALWLCRLLLGFTPIPASGLDPFRPAAAFAGVAVLAYAALSGGGESVVRATVMSLVALAALWRGSAGSAGRAMAFAALVLSVVSPGSVADAGFQLSFIATAAILAYAERLRALASRRVTGPVFFALTIGLLCWAVTAPILAYDFGRVSLVAPLAGAVTGLPCGVAVIAGLAGAALLPVAAEVARWCFEVAAWGGAAVVATARFAALPGWAEVAVVSPGPWATAGLVALPFLPVLPPARQGRALVAVLAIIATAIAHTAHARWRSDTTDFVFASVGQGDATIVRLAGGKTLLVDGGPPGRGHSVVAPLLRRMAIARLDYVVATHVQDDHWGGLADLLEERGVEIGELWYPGGVCKHQRFHAFTERLAARGTAVLDVGAALSGRVGDGRPPAVVRRGEGWSVRALWPRDAGGACDDNDRSVVVLVRFGAARVLLTGDIERGAEQQLARRPRRIRAALLKAPHHGSKTSSSARLIDAVRPRAALASSGLANRYGFPHREVLARYESRGVRCYRTDVDGALCVRAYRDRIVLAPITGPRRTLAIDPLPSSTPFRSHTLAARVRGSPARP